MKKFKVLDLFSGIGGFSLGLERTGGYETTAFCEIDERARLVLKKHWPDIKIFEDVRDIDGNNFKNHIDVICGGFPCQDISVAGKGAGLKGERSGLWFEFKRLIQEIKPRYAIIENVANLRSKGLARVIKDLWEIGYNAEWHIISACSIGAVHRRERIWIVAYSNSERLERCRAKGEQESETRIEETRIDGFHERVCDERGNETTSITDSNSDSLRKQSRRECWKEGEREKVIRDNGQETITSDTYDFRLWKSFTSEKERWEWWTEATASFSNVFSEIVEIEPTVCRDNDGLSKGLHKHRVQRIKQLGNSIVPQIVELIGDRILIYEGLKPAIDADIF